MGWQGAQGDIGLQGAQGNDGAQGLQGIEGAQGLQGIEGSQGDNGTDGAQGAQGLQGNSAKTYLARLEFDSASALVGGYFLDPTGIGTFKTTGATVGSPSGYNITFAFSNESLPPVSVLAYAADARTGANAKYVITHLNAGGDNLSYWIKGISSWSTFSSTLTTNQVDANLFSAFSGLNIQLDVQSANFDWARNSLSPVQNTHMYILFRF